MQKASKPGINPELKAAYAAASKKAVERVSEVKPILKRIMYQLHDEADAAHQQGDKTEHQINCMAANKIAELLQYVNKL